LIGWLTDFCKSVAAKMSTTSVSMHTTTHEKPNTETHLKSKTSNIHPGALVWVQKANELWPGKVTNIKTFTEKQVYKESNDSQSIQKQQYLVYLYGPQNEKWYDWIQ
jgi:hypothetical protein